MSGKVVLPKEVAEAIDKLLGGINGCTFNNYGIINELEVESSYGEYPQLKVLSDYFYDFEPGSYRHPNVLMAALVNGYEVDMTPEEKVREYYESVRGQGDFVGFTTDAISKTLDILGIKIEGVNG